MKFINEKQIEEYFALTKAHLIEAEGHWKAAKIVANIMHCDSIARNEAMKKLDMVKQCASMAEQLMGKNDSP